MELNNFNCCMEIISGLQSSSVYRLRQTWAVYITVSLCGTCRLYAHTHSCDNCAQLIDSKQRRKYEETQLVMAREKNFQNFRAHLHQVHTTARAQHAQSSALTLN
jgi:hypothetical protein